MKPNYSISIPRPCHEDWSKMTPSEKGRFCQSCSKTVVDFTKMNTNQIQEYIHTNKSQNICGHIKQHQLDTINLKIPEFIFKRTLSFHKLFLLALLLTMGTSILSCSDKKGNIQKVETVEIIEKRRDSISKKKDTIQESEIKKTDSIKIKKPNIPIPNEPLIMGDVVVVDGLIEATPYETEEPYPYNYVDETPKFLKTPSNLSKDEERKYFHKEIKTILDDNFKVEQGTSSLKGKQRIYCQFEINKIGIIENLKIRASHHSFEDEAKRVFKLFPRFIPAKHNGQNVSSVFSLPIMFMIED